MLANPWAAALALAIFVVAYFLFATREEQRTLVAAVAAALGLLVSLVSVGVWTLSSATVSSAGCALFGYAPSDSPWHLCTSSGVVEWDTMGLLLGLFLLAALLQRLQVFRYLALRLARKTQGRPMALFLAMSLLSFALSAFLNSITVMLVLATITVEVCRSLRISPVNLLLAEISCSNVGGAATFVGDPPNVILGTYFGLGFDSFLLYAAPLALAALGVTLVGFWVVNRRDERTHRSAGPSSSPPAAPSEAAGVPDLPQLDRPKVMLASLAFAAVIGLLAINSLIPPSVGEIGLLGAAMALLLAGRKEAGPLLRDVDWNTLAFFFFLFLMVGSLEFTGVISAVASGLSSAGARSVFLLAALLLWSLGLLSSVVDNVPLAAAAGPLIAAIHAQAGVPVGRLVYPSAVGTDVGGNGTPIGASANVVGLAVAKRAGVAISWRTYLVRAFPIMVLSLLAATAVLAFWP